jgi:hypothetical protein
MDLDLREVLNEIADSNPTATKLRLYELAKQQLRVSFLSTEEYDLAKDELQDRIWGMKK